MIQRLGGLQKFVGGRPTLGSVTYSLLIEFARSMQSRRCSQKNAKMLAGCIRSIVRAWNGEALARVLALPPAAPGSLRHYFEQCYRPQVLFNCKCNTAKDHERSQRALYHSAGGDVPLNELRDATVVKLLDELRDRGMPSTTVNKYPSNTGYRSATKHSTRGSSSGRCVFEKKLREVLNQPESWTLDEMKKLLAAARRFRIGETYGPLQCNAWWAAMLHVAYETGLRRGSLLSIRQSDIAAGWLTIDGSNTKSLKGQSFRLSEKTISALREIWEPEQNMVFDHCPPYALNKHFGLLIDAAGIRRCRRKGLGKFHMIPPHDSNADRSPGRLAAASSMLGHSDSYVTRRYVNPTQLKHDATGILPSLVAG